MGSTLSKVRLSISVGDSDLNRALIDGSVKPEGVDAAVLSMPPPERHVRMFNSLEFDVCEVGLSALLNLKAYADFPVQAIPAFTLCRMRHANIYINRASGIRTPQDLHGRRVGLRTWEVTAGVWARGILQDDYGVDLSRIHWLTAVPEEIPFRSPDWLRLEQLPPGSDVDRMLVSGELDAVVYSRSLPSIIRRDPRVGHLWDDPKQEEIAYYRRTGIMPIMHCVVIKDSVLAAHPWVAMSVLKAFRESKARALRRYQHDSLYLAGLCWSQDLWDEQEALMGTDPFPYALAPCRPAMATICRYAHEQGFTPRLYQPEELFYPPALADLPSPS